MGDKPWILDPPLATLPAWGWPLPIWWFLLVVVVLAVVLRQRRHRQARTANAAWCALQKVVAETVQQPNALAAKVLAQAVKQTLLQYLPRRRVAAMRVEEAWAELCLHCGVEPHAPTQQWLSHACYGGEPMEVSADITAHLKALARAMTYTARPKVPLCD